MELDCLTHARFLRGARALFFAVGAVALSPVVTTATPADGEAGGECYQITGESSYRGFGYKHIVTVTNHCSASIECKVWTDVDPSPKHALTVPKSSKKSVVTRISSPTAAFSARGACNGSTRDDA